MNISIKRMGCSVLILVFGFGVGLVLPDESFAQKFPVFKLAGPKVDKGKATKILKNLHGGKMPPGLSTKDRADAVVQKAGKKEVEISKASGGIFMRDVDKLWNPKQKPRLPNREQAKSAADKFLAENELLPRSGPNHKVSFAGFSKTAFSSLSPDGKTEQGETAIDVQADYKVDISVKGADGKEMRFPVVGGGGKFKVAVGEDGEVIGYHGVWREIASVAGMEDIISRDQAIAEFKKHAGKTKITKAEAFLAYDQGDFTKGQQIMAPVWVVKAETDIDGEAVPIRNVHVGATKYGPKLRKVPPPKGRMKDAPPIQRSLDQDEKSGQNMLDFLVTPAYANPAYEAGTSCLYTESGLPGCGAVCGGFRNKLKSAGWQINFSWLGNAAFESDWIRNDDSWVDAADIVFYCGHANMNGWSAKRPDDTSIHYSETAGALDRWGQNDLEWIIIAACGPLQDSHFVSGGGSAFTRWRPAFDGLHILMGYGAVTYDNTREGTRFAELALAGWRLIDAWFRTGWEIQPSTNGYAPPNGPRIYVAAMYAHKGDHATRQDRLWGRGYVAPDPIPPVWLTLMWQGT